METIAVTSWGGIVSPVFDTACCFELVQSTGGRARVEVRVDGLAERVQLLEKYTAGVLICGAISQCALSMVAGAGIEVAAWIRGPVDDVLRALAGGHLYQPRYVMPGCRRLAMAGSAMPGGRRCDGGRCRRHWGGR